MKMLRRLIIGLTVLAGVGALTATLIFPHGFPTTHLAATRAGAATAAAPAAAPVLEAHEDSDLARSERIEGAGWIWRPVLQDLAQAERAGGALRFLAPISDKATGASLKGQVFIDGRPLGWAQEVDLLLLMRGPPVDLRVEAQGYLAWDVSLGFTHHGFKTLHGRVELYPDKP